MADASVILIYDPISGDLQSVVVSDDYPDAATLAQKHAQEGKAILPIDKTTFDRGDLQSVADTVAQKMRQPRKYSAVVDDKGTILNVILAPPGFIAEKGTLVPMPGTEQDNEGKLVVGGTLIEGKLTLPPQPDPAKFPGNKGK